MQIMKLLLLFITLSSIAVIFYQSNVATEKHVKIFVDQVDTIIAEKRQIISLTVENNNFSEIEILGLEKQ